MRTKHNARRASEIHSKLSYCMTWFMVKDHSWCLREHLLCYHTSHQIWCMCCEGFLRKQQNSVGLSLTGAKWHLDSIQQNTSKQPHHWGYWYSHNEQSQGENQLTSSRQWLKWFRRHIRDERRQIDSTPASLRLLLSSAKFWNINTDSIYFALRGKIYALGILPLIGR